MQSRFGEGSVQVTSIWNVLGAFGAGIVSKKETVTAIKLVLSHHHDLMQALMDVLYHPEADWDVGDFDFGSPQPNHLAIPSLLQPAHQPRFHPSPIHWHEDQQAHTSQRLSYNQTWSSTPTESVGNHAQSLAVDYPDIYPRHPESHSPQPAFQETLASETTLPYSLSAPMLLSNGQSVKNMSIPSKKRRCDTFEDQISQHAMDQEPESAEQTGLPNTNTVRPIAPSRRQSQTKGQRSQNEDRPKQFIHGLCGKGFVARCKVKKHHWGNVLNDLETTTGCWAKHGKPNISWDDHPSCKKTSKVPDRAWTTSPITQTDGESQEKSQIISPTAPTAPTSSSVHQPHGGIEYTPNMHEHYRDDPQGTNLYHMHRLPHRSSFDTLLEAANMISQVDAAQLQVRTDSLATQLSAQATAAKHSGQYVTDWQNTLGGYHSEAVVARGYLQPYTMAGSNFLYPPRGHHVPLEVALPFYGRPQAHTPHMYPTTSGNSIDDPTSMLNDAHTTSRRALLSPFSPDPRVRSRTMQEE